MTNPGKVIVEVGKALGKAVVAGLGLELARLTTQQLRRRLGVHDEDARKNEDAKKDDDAHGAKSARGRDSGEVPAGATDNAVAALRRENEVLRAELAALRDEVRGQKKEP
jgi:hypothetical protein